MKSRGVRLFSYVLNKMPTWLAEVMFLHFAVGNFKELCFIPKNDTHIATGSNVNEVMPDGSAQWRVAHCDNELYN